MLCPPYHHSHPLPGITSCLHTSQRQAASILLLLYLVSSFTAACFPPLLPRCLSSSFHIPHHLPSPLLLCCVLLHPSSTSFHTPPSLPSTLPSYPFCTTTSPPPPRPPSLLFFYVAASPPPSLLRHLLLF